MTDSAPAGSAVLDVGFIGLGAIGRPMAAHLARSHRLTVWNRTAARAQAFATQYGATAADSPAALARAATVILTCLPTSREVADLLDGADGLLAGLRPDALVLDCTSGDPATSRRLASRLGERGVAFADTPVSGGTNGAEAGTLTVMVGGSAEAFARARPVLQCFGEHIVHLGPVGAGHAMKAVNNTLLAVNILAFAEGVTALVKAGVSPATAVEVLNASSGRSFVSRSLVPERVLTGEFPKTFRLALLAKDVGIAVDLLDQLGLPAPLLHRTGELMRQARTALGEQADYLETIKLAEAEAGAVIRG